MRTAASIIRAELRARWRCAPSFIDASLKPSAKTSPIGGMEHLGWIANISASLANDGRSQDAAALVEHRYYSENDERRRCAHAAVARFEPAQKSDWRQRPSLLSVRRLRRARKG